MKPLVSVILSSYNYDKYVGEAIRSVLNQTYRNLEIIVVDDGSRDHSREVIESTLRETDLPTRTIFKENGGQSSAFNAAYEHLQGELVTFIDSDDEWRENKLEAMVGLYGTCPEGGVYQHQVEVGFGGSNRLEYILSGDVFRGWEQIGRLNLATYQGRISPFVPTVGLMFRKEVLDQVFPIPRELITCPDAYLTRTSAAYGPLYSHPGVLATWRDHEENAGKGTTYGYHEYWLPVIMPALNRFYRERGFGVEFYYEASTEETRTLPNGNRASSRWLNRILGRGRS